MRFGPYFALLNGEFEHKKSGKIITEAERDAKGVWTGPGGSITHADGNPVKEGDTWTEAEALQLYADKKAQFARSVWDLIDEDIRPLLKQHQFDALGVLAWNIGMGNFRTSTALTKVNMGRFEEAAAAFLLFYRMTLEGGSNGPDGKPARDPHGNALAPGVNWFKAMRGLLRRSASAALLFSGKNWRDAAAPNKIFLNSVAVWTGKRWYDEVQSHSQWKDILADAQDDPLPMIHGTEPEEKEVMVETIKVHGGRTLTLPANWDAMTPAQKTAWLNGDQETALKAAKVIGAKKIVNVPNIPTTNEKPMDESETYRGLKKKDSGKELIGVGAGLAGAAGATNTINDLTQGASKMTTTVSDTTSSILGFTQEQWVILGIFVGLPLILYGGWRIIRGTIIAEDGRARATQAKV